MKLASFRMPVYSIVEAAHCPAAEPLLLTIGRAGVLSCRAVAAGELETLLSLLGQPGERQRSDLKRATDIVLIENGAVIYWPRTGAQFHINDAAYAMARVQATLAMSTAALKRELALLAALSQLWHQLSPPRSATHRLGRTHRGADPRSLAARCAALRRATPAPQCDATKRQEHSGRAESGLDRAAGRSCRGGLAVAAAIRLPVPQARPPLVASEASFRRETLTEVELVSGGLAVSLPGDRRAMLRGLSLRHVGGDIIAGRRFGMLSTIARTVSEPATRPGNSSYYEARAAQHRISRGSPDIVMLGASLTLRGNWHELVPTAQVTPTITVDPRHLGSEQHSQRMSPLGRLQLCMDG